MSILTTDSWTGADVTVSEVEAGICALRDDAGTEGQPPLRTSVMTHIAWVPRDWVDAATSTLAGLGERHPSRTILLLPEPEGDDRLDAEIALECFPLEAGRHVCSEVVRLRLGGRRAQAPASIVLPLLISDLPVFLRWRGQPPFRAGEWEQLTAVADRLVVDSSEWPDLYESLRALTGSFDRVAVSDLAWARTQGWRVAVAAEWPGIEETRALAVTGPRAEAALLVGWLRSRLGREIALEHEQAAELAEIRLDGRSVEPPRAEPASSSDLLSAELEQFGRDAVYEAAVTAASQGRDPSN